jgi:hypothetical protein
LVDTGDSSYARTTDGHDSICPLREDRSRVRSNPRISWLEGTVNNPYRYTAHVHDEPAGPDPSESHQTFVTSAAASQARPLVIPPGNDEVRANRFPGSLRKSRPQTMYCRPKEAHLDLGVAQNSRFISQLYVIEEDDAIKEARQEIRCIKIMDALSTKSTLLMARNALGTGSSTLRMLQGQGEQLQNTENDLGWAADASDEGALK